MTKSTVHLIANLDLVLKANRINATRFCELCEGHGIKLTRSTVSRVMQGNNIGLETLSDLANGIKACFPEFGWVTESDLISDRFNTDKVLLKNNQFRGFVIKLMDDLNDIGWVNLNKDTSTIADFSSLLAKDFGIVTEKAKP